MQSRHLLVICAIHSLLDILLVINCGARKHLLDIHFHCGRIVVLHFYETINLDINLTFVDHPCSFLHLKFIWNNNLDIYLTFVHRTAFYT